MAAFFFGRQSASARSELRAFTATHGSREFKCMARARWPLELRETHAASGRIPRAVAFSRNHPLVGRTLGWLFYRIGTVHCQVFRIDRKSCHYSILAPAQRIFPYSCLVHLATFTFRSRKDRNASGACDSCLDGDDAGC